MELFNRVKSILFNPKEEWEVIEAENAPQGKVLQYLLVLSLIPAAASFFHQWWTWWSMISKAKDAILKTYGEIAGNEYAQKALAAVTENSPFFKTVGIWGILQIVNQFAIILLGVYLTAKIINAFSDQFGASKDFNRTFSLVTYAYTPLCIAGILYILAPLAWLVPFLALYGIYLLFIGVKPLIKPAAEKQSGYAIMALIVTVVAYLIMSKAVPMITREIYTAVVTSQMM